MATKENLSNTPLAFPGGGSSVAQELNKGRRGPQRWKMFQSTEDFELNCNVKLETQGHTLTVHALKNLILQYKMTD